MWMDQYDIAAEYIKIPESPKRIFYNYLWSDPADGTPRYIGKGQKSRVFSHLKHKNNPQLHYMLNKRLREGLFLHPWIEYAINEEECYAFEIFWIAYFGRLDTGCGTLFNKTDGGDKPPVRRGKQGPLTDEQKAKRRETRIANGTDKPTDETKLLWSMQRKGKPNPKNKNHASRPRGTISTEEHKRKVGEANSKKNLKDWLVTPDGKFETFAEVANYYNITISAAKVRYRPNRHKWIAAGWHRIPK